MDELWEILVPRAFNDGTVIPTAYHQIWDKWVRQTAGGLTILRSAKGIWESPSGEIFSESMVPVRIACSEAQVREIIDLTLKHYHQEAVMAYRISTHVIIKHR
jgi:hypothetical protein